MSSLRTDWAGHDAIRGGPVSEMAQYRTANTGMMWSAMS
jgi:hypothetical protein